MVTSMNSTKIRRRRRTTDQIFIGFARVYSGTLKVGDEIFVLPPDFLPEKAAADANFAKSIPKIVITGLYLMMGRELEPIPAAAAGAIVGISGLENFLAKSGTLSSTLDCPAFFRQRFYAEPIIRVAVEPADLKDIGKLAEGLKLLNRSDPSAKTYVQDTGEHVLVTAGEVHLQRCLDDLRRRFAKVDFKVSAPIVPFLETIVAPPKFDMVNESIAAPAPESGSAAGGGGKKSGTPPAPSKFLRPIKRVCFGCARPRFPPGSSTFCCKMKFCSISPTIGIRRYRRICRRVGRNSAIGCGRNSPNPNPKRPIFRRRPLTEFGPLAHEKPGRIF